MVETLRVALLAGELACDLCFFGIVLTGCVLWFEAGGSREKHVQWTNRFMLAVVVLAGLVALFESAHGRGGAQSTLALHDLLILVFAISFALNRSGFTGWMHRRLHISNGIFGALVLIGLSLTGTLLTLR